MGILLLIIEFNFFFIMIGVIFFGGIFVGIVCLVLIMVGCFYFFKFVKFMGKMMIFYGIV